jgi:hypothetical protein
VIRRANGLWQASSLFFHFSPEPNLLAGVEALFSPPSDHARPAPGEKRIGTMHYHICDRLGIASASAVMAVLFLLSGEMSTSMAQAKKGGLTPYLNKLKGTFTSLDLNGDGFLDKEELAKAFRGPDAKPFDFKKAPVEKPAKIKTECVVLASLPVPALASGMVIAEVWQGQMPAANLDNKSASKPDYSKYPDYLFLQQYDTNQDEKISKKEFDVWARDYAQQWKNYDDAQKRLAKAQAQYNKATTAKARQQAQASLKSIQQEVAKINREMQRFQKLMSGK